MSPLAAADLAALESAHRKLEGSIGTQRLRAAEKALAHKRRPKSATGVGSSSVASTTPRPNYFDDTLSLARAAGIPRFSATTASPSVVTENDGTLPSAESATAELDTLALARSAGIARFGPTESAKP